MLRLMTEAVRTSIVRMAIVKFSNMIEKPRLGGILVSLHDRYNGQHVMRWKLLIWALVLILVVAAVVSPIGIVIISNRGVLVVISRRGCRMLSSSSFGIRHRRSSRSSCSCLRSAPKS